MRTKNLGLKKTSYAYPEQYDVMHIPEDTFLRQLFNRPLKPVTVGYIRYRDNIVECYPVVNGTIVVDKILYTEKIPDKYGNATIPAELRDRVMSKCFSALAKFYRFRKIK